MARFQQTRQTKRTQVDSRNTFDFSTPNISPVAHPVDPYVVPNEGQGWRQLADSLGIMSDSLDSLQPFMKEYASQQYEKGRIAALTGQEKPSSGYYKITAYEEALGSVTASVEYKKALQDYFQENFNQAAPEDFQQGLEALTQEFLGGQTDNFIRGFVPKAQSLEQAVINEYHSFLASEHHSKSLNIVGELSNSGITDNINSILQDSYELEGVQTIDDIINNPYMYGKISADDSFKDTLSSTLRKNLTDIQKQGMAMGLTRKEISAKYIEFLGRFAVNNGMPEVLDMAYQQDKSGISLSTGELSGTIAQYKDQAERARQSLVLAADRAAEERSTKQQQLFLNETDATIMNLSLIEDPKQRAQLAWDMEAKLFQDPSFMNLDNTSFRRILGELKDFQRGEFNMPDFSNQQVYADLYAEALGGTLTLDTLQEMKNAGELSLDDWKGLYSKVVENNKAALEESKQWKDKTFIYDIIDETTNYLVEKNMGDFKDNERAAGFSISMYDAIYAYMLENERRGPSLHEFVKEILNPVLETYGTSYGSIMQAGLGDQEALEITQVNLEEEQTKVDKDISEVQAYEEDKANVSLGEHVQALFVDDTAKVNFLKERALPDLKTFSPMKWGYSLEEANTRITEALTNGFTIAQIQELWQEYMKSEKATKFYLYNYLYDYTQQEFARLVEEPNISVPEALKAIKDRLLAEWGVPEDMALDIMKGIGFKEEEWEV